MKALLLLLASCASDPPALAPQHPANPKAAPGRLVGASATLRPGVTDYKDLPSVDAAPPPMHHHHGS
ncbi:MAG: hypothetical protein QM831_23405 [Kofleriaceae bacterium]